MLYRVYQIQYVMSVANASLYRIPEEGIIFFRDLAPELSHSQAVEAVEAFYGLPCGLIDVVSFELWDEVYIDR